MSTIQIKAAIVDAATRIPDEAPEELLQEVLEFLRALHGADQEKLVRIRQFYKNIEEDKNLLLRLAQ
ncbi:MAG: hypothetical protein KF797_08435 [Flavobacteriales bacterium]|nr:hypothetical protein [Flavobacteriales bacterium]